MKKLIFSIFCILLLSGCSKNLNCSLNLNEDEATTDINVFYTFGMFGKQVSRDETTTITFQNKDDFDYYAKEANSIYNIYSDTSLNFNITSDSDLMSVKVTRQITNNDIDKNSLEELNPKGSLSYKKVKKHYEDNGYNCK